jgi:ATP-binding protein involved in chromosome partitioning
VSSDEHLIQEIHKRLSSVIDPELGMNIVELGMVKDVQIKDNTANIVIGLTISGCPLRTQIRNDVNSRLSGIEGIKSFHVEFTVLSAEEKAVLMDKVRRKISIDSKSKGYLKDTRILAIASGKGGVGKSTVSVNLAVGLLIKGFRVGILDADIGGFSIPRLLGVNDEIQVQNKKMLPVEKLINGQSLKVLSMGFLTNEDKAIMWRGLMLAKAFEQFIVDVNWGQLDYLIIDMPPGTSDIQLSLPRLLPHSDILIVTTPSVSAQMVASRVAEMASKSYLRVAGVIENMSYFICDHGQKSELFGAGGGNRLSQSLGVPLLAQLPLESNNSKYADNGSPIIQGNHLISKVFMQLVDKVTTDIAPPLQMSSCSARLIQKFEALT